MSEERQQLDQDRRELARSRRELSEILGEFAATTEEADTQAVERSRLAAARQSLTEEMSRLLGAGFERSDNVVGGITVDSEYVIFVIDTSGSMQRFAWGSVVRKVGETLSIYPDVKGIQVMNDMGDYMFANFRDRWIPDSPVRREAIMRRLETWTPFSNSSPVEGIEKAITTSGRRTGRSASTSSATTSAGRRSKRSWTPSTGSTGRRGRGAARTDPRRGLPGHLSGSAQATAVRLPVRRPHARTDLPQQRHFRGLGLDVLQ